MVEQNAIQRGGEGTRRVGILLALAGVVLAVAVPATSVEGGAERDGVPLEARQGRMRDALEVLIRTPSGRGIVARAQSYWNAREPQGILGHVRWGKASRTDAVVTRYYNTSTGEERRERQVVVYLKRGQRLEELVLDLAHELVHATSRPAWDPYDPELTPARYIQAAIEGTGGEVDAVEAECRVSFEMQERFGTPSRRCQEYASDPEARDPGAREPSRIDRRRILGDFYRVGSWRRELDERFAGELARFPLLSSREPALYSSTGRTPYPVALSREYDEITEIACRNARKRRSLAASSGVSGASSSSGTSEEAFLKSRCGG